MRPPLIPAPSGRARTVLTRLGVWGGLAVVLAAMAFGGRDPQMDIVIDPAPAAPVHTERIGPLRQAPKPARVAAALKKVGIDVRTVSLGDATLITTAGAVMQQGALNIEYGELPHGMVVWPPRKCMTIRADLGVGAWVTYAPSQIDAGPDGCLPSNADLTPQILEVLEGAAG